MKTLLNATLVLFMACSTGDTTPMDDDTGDRTDRPWDARFDATASAFLEQLEELGAPGVSVAIVENGAVTFSQGFGSRHPEENTSPDGATLYRIGSVTKMMSAVSLLQQIEASNSSFTEPIATLMPDLTFSTAPSRHEEIQLQHLLTHQGGFYDWTPISGSAEPEFMETFIETTFALNAPFIAPAGAFFNYSNPNFMLAGYAAQRLDGQRFYTELMMEDVFKPLGMDRTYFYADEVLNDNNYASGATIDWTGETTEARIATPSAYDHGAMRPAGFAWSSAEQLALFANFLMQGDTTVLSETSRLAMTGDQIDTLMYPDFQHYGYGIFVNKGFNGNEGYYPTQVWQHGGAIFGYSAQLFIVPDHKFAIAVLSNTDGAYFNAAIATAAESIISELPTPQPFPDPQVNFADFERYVGTYIDPNNVGVLSIGLTDGVLTVDAPTLEQYGYKVGPSLNPTSKDNFQLFINDQPYLITFIDKEDGTPSYYLRNRIFVATRDATFNPHGHPPVDIAAFEKKRVMPHAPATLWLP